MAYIGKINKSTSTLATQTMDSMTGDGTTTTLSLTSTPLDVNDVSIYIDGVMQQPGVDYTLDGNTVTFTTAVPLNCYVCACQTQNGDIGTPAADSVTTAKLTDGMFTDSHIPSLSASKLTGALPTIDGSALTGVGSGFMEMLLIQQQIQILLMVLEQFGLIQQQEVFIFVPTLQQTLMFGLM